MGNAGGFTRGTAGATDDCVKWDASGNLVTAGAACGSGEGGASDTLHVFKPSDNEPPAASYATLDTRNSHPVLDFDADADEIAVFSGILNRGYGGSGFTINIHYAMTSAEAAEVIWCVAWERIGDGQQDLDADGFAAANCSAATTVPGTTGLVDILGITFTDGADSDSVAVGEGFRLQERQRC